MSNTTKFSRSTSKVIDSQEMIYSIDKDLRTGKVELIQNGINKGGDTFDFITISSRNGADISISDFDALQALHKALGMAIEACHASPSHKA